MKSICLITPSLVAGGAERVMTELANHWVDNRLAIVHLIVLTGGDQFYTLDKRVTVHKPSFRYKEYSRFIYTVKIFWFLRKTIRWISPNSILAFGGKYNSFTILSNLGNKVPVFISDRSRPGISYGSLLNWINPIVYKLSSGIIAQTNAAMEFILTTTGHKNVKVIGNPISDFYSRNPNRTNTIINVGRFIKSKQQILLLELFNSIKLENWNLLFLGDGPELSRVKRRAMELGIEKQVQFLGNVIDVKKYYESSKIFAFTSNSEGFPNVLGEAMASGLACVSFDCVAGPSELITNEINGILVPINDLDLFRNSLEKMMKNPGLLASYSKAGRNSISKYDISFISKKYLEFITKKL